MSDSLTADSVAPLVADPGAGAPEPEHPGEPSAIPSVTSMPTPQMEAVLLERLLGIADAHRAQNHLHQAIEMYFKLVEDLLHTPQGEQACQRLMGIAANFERAGEHHMARDIYERLLRR